MRSSLVALVLGMVLGSSPTRADLITTFDATGTFDDGSTLSGTVTIDVTTGGATAIDLTTSPPDPFSFSTIINQFSTSGRSLIVGDKPAGNAHLIFDIPEANLVGYTGGTLSTDSVLENF
jgi:hypothetical protein